MEKRKDIKKKLQLGMPYGTANNKLKKTILFDLIKKLNIDFCYRCGLKIENERELSIEHKIAWLDSEDPKKMFFDLDNIGFSHLSCNCRDARNMKKGTAKHPSVNSYKEGCRCDECRKLHTEDYRKRKHRKK
jgi:hypothetical protein